MQMLLCKYYLMERGVIVISGGGGAKIWDYRIGRVTRKIGPLDRGSRKFYPISFQKMVPPPIINDNPHYNELDHSTVK